MEEAIQLFDEALAEQEPLSERAAPRDARGVEVDTQRDHAPLATQGGENMVIYIWKRNGWRKFKVRDN